MGAKPYMLDRNDLDVPISRSTKTLQGNLGTADVVFTVLAYNAPIVTVVAFLPFVIFLGNGVGAPAIFVAAGAMLLIFAAGFTTMSKYVPNAGAYYAYISKGLGRSLGLGGAMLAITSYVFMLLGGYLYAGIVTAQLVKSLAGHPYFRWWEWSLIVWCAVSTFGYFRINLSARILSIALACEVLAVLAWEAAIAISKGPSVFAASWLTPQAVISGSLPVGILFGVTCFSGFEATAVFREEARNPERTIPRATYIAIIFMTFLFMSAVFLLIAGYGPEATLKQASANAEQLTANSFKLFLGQTGRWTVDLLVCSSQFAASLAMHNILARYVYSLSIDGIIPRGLSEVHVRHESPYKASLLVTLAMAIGIVIVAETSGDPYMSYGVLQGMAGFGLLTLQVLTALSIFAFFRRKPSSESIWKTRIAPIVSFVFLLVCDAFAAINIHVLTGSEKIGLILVIVFLGTFVAGVLYAIRIKRRNPRVYAAIGRQRI